MSKDHDLSKLLSFWLRHDPGDSNLAVDPSGWAATDDVLTALAARGRGDCLADLVRVVQGSDKNRFELSADGSLIRARQGHSIPVNLDWPVTAPPEFLFHGTVDRFLAAIRAEGLRPMARHHVHLSPDIETASIVGARRGKPMVLRVAAAQMAEEGHVFRLSSNGVWLTDKVPPAFLHQL